MLITHLELIITLHYQCMAHAKCTKFFNLCNLYHFIEKICLPTFADVKGVLRDHFVKAPSISIKFEISGLLLLLHIGTSICKG